MGRVASRPLGSDTMTLKSCTSFTRPSTNSPSVSVWHHKNHANSRCIWWVSDTTTIIQFHTVFDECVTPQQSCKFTQCSLSIWHHNNHANSHWASGALTLHSLSIWHNNNHTNSHCRTVTWHLLFTLWNLHLAFAVHFVKPSLRICYKHCGTFTWHSPIIWHHNNHEYKFTLQNLHLAFTECLTPWHSYKFTLQNLHLAFAECLTVTPRHSYKFTLQKLHLAFAEILHHNKHTTSHSEIFTRHSVATAIHWASGTIKLENIKMYVLEPSFGVQQHIKTKISHSVSFSYHYQSLVHGIGTAALTQKYKLTLHCGINNKIQSTKACKETWGSSALSKRIGLTWYKQFWFYLWWWNWKHYEQSSYSYFFL